MYISCVVNAVVMVERLLRNTGSVSHIAGFHTAKHLINIILINSFLPANAERDNGIEQVMFWQQCNEAEVQAHAEFARRLV
jgi:hypothetical protein